MLKPSFTPAIPFNVRNNMDRYGFTAVLARFLGKRSVPRAFCEWMHGWYWFEDELVPADVFGPLRNKFSYPMVVVNTLQLEKVRGWGYSNIFAGGLPICYVPEVGVSRNPHSLIGFLEHSAEQERFSVPDIAFLDFLADHRKNYEYVGVCVFALDKSPELSREIERRGLWEVSGADPRDRNSMIRTREIFEHFGNVVGNCMGSYIAYGFFFGANVTLFTPFFQKPPDVFLGTSQGYSPADIERFLHFWSEPYARAKFPDLFLEVGRASNADRERGKAYVGWNSVMSKSEIVRVASWTVTGQTRGYAIGGLRRLARALAP
jgi:hypothetical protein